jgi:hypothetical protein
LSDLAGSRRLTSALGAAALVLCLATPAAAKPQWNAGVEAGFCGRGSSLGVTEPAFCGALRADVLFLAKRGSDVAFGPSLRLGTAAFDDVRLDAGAAVLLPVTDAFPLVIEAGPHLRNFSQPGIYGSIFFGLRSFNHYGHYEMASGLAITAERTFTGGSPSALWLSARIDASWLALPFVAGYNALR